MTSRKRSGSGSSKRPKEKVVYIYEIFFRGENPENSQQERPDFSEFWNEFFLLQPNVEALEMEVTKLTAEQFTVVKPNLNVIFQKCIEILDTGECVHGHFCCSLSGKCVGVVLLLVDNFFSLFLFNRSSQAFVQQPTDPMLIVLCHIQKVYSRYFI